MNDYSMDAAFKKLAEYVPKAPEQSVELMVKTVNALNAEKQRRAVLSGAAPEAAKEAPQKKMLDPEVTKKAPGMKI